MVPIVKTDRLALRPWKPDDAEAFFGIYGDPRVSQHLTMPPFPDLASARARLAAVMAMNAERGFGHWAMIEADGTLVGSAGFRPVAASRDLEVGFTVAPSRWGRGYASEIAAACVLHGFSRLGAPRILSATAKANTPARRVMDKIGMRFLRTDHDEGVDWCVYVVERAEDVRTPEAR
jgi:RimJ/RimL family protein N-acetyltransferase